MKAGTNGAQTFNSDPDSVPPHKANQPSTGTAANVPNSAATPSYRLQGVAACLEHLRAFGELCGTSNQQKLREFLNDIFDYQEVTHHSKSSATYVTKLVSTVVCFPLSCRCPHNVAWSSMWHL